MNRTLCDPLIALRNRTGSFDDNYNRYMAAIYQWQLYTCGSKEVVKPARCSIEVIYRDVSTVDVMCRACKNPEAVQQ